ncbi:MAG: aspartate--ammonia ligase [Flavobacteriales bacterium]|nr:aspartate--ammonia ligase [Flavobacteriales bacterium]
MHKHIINTEKAIALVKDTFTHQLASALNLTKVSAPIAIQPGTGLNDDLNGIERPVSFPVKDLDDQHAVVVHSLAKWKRLRLAELGIPQGEGIVTDMRALRPDEDFSPLHSIYVDQWDWEKVISKEERSITFLKETVSKIYQALLSTEKLICATFPKIDPALPPKLSFITSQELLDLYPELTPKQRETEYLKKHKAVFLIGIGGELSHGKAHDGRAPDYDDWTTPTELGFGLNGDLLVWHPKLEQAFELSSMGIRVDAQSLEKQLEIRDCTDRLSLPFHQKIMKEEVPLSIGGGIGQSRMAMFMLRKEHIGEVQVGLWSDEYREKMRSEGIELL